MFETFKWAVLAGLICCGTAWANPDVPLHHLVLVSFTEHSTVQQRQQIVADSITLLQQIPGVEYVSAGPKARDDRAVHFKDFDVGIYVRLKDASLLDAYSAHPLHQAVLRQNKAVIESIRVVDFSATTLEAE